MNSRSAKLEIVPKGFTLIEVLIVIGIVAILAAIVVVAVNPTRQFAQARNSQRTAHVNSILNAIGQNIADNKGIFTCDPDGDGDNDPIPTTTTEISDSAYNIYECLVPLYLPSLPFDPGNENVDLARDAHFTDDENYETGYTIELKNSRAQICAPGAVEESISGSTPICVTR